MTETKNIDPSELVGVLFQDTPRVAPQDIDAEQSVLGGMLLSKDAIADVVGAGRLTYHDFYYPKHQEIYEAILQLYNRGEPADPITVAAELERHQALERIGGALYLHTLTNIVPTAASTVYYADIVVEKAILRRLIEAGTRIVQYGYAGLHDGDIEATVNLAQAEIYQVADRHASQDCSILGDLLTPIRDEIEAIGHGGEGARGIISGFIDLDSLTNGFHPGQMIVIAARPGMGKSTLALDFVRACSLKHGLCSVIFSLEMSKSEIIQRIFSAETGINLKKIRSGQLNDHDWTVLVHKISAMSEAPLFIDDSPNMTIMEIRAKARRLKQRHQLRMIVVDYLQLMTSGKRVESRQQEVSEFSRQLKLLAKELDVPVIALSQLNRSPEHRSDRRPALADLRESGAIEQDADVVILLHRPDAISTDLTSIDGRPGEAELILAKHRNGETRTVIVAHQLDRSRFVNLARNTP